MTEETKIMENAGQIPASIEKIILNFDMTKAREVYQREFYSCSQGRAYHRKEVSTMRIVQLPFTLEAPYRINDDMAYLSNVWLCCYSPLEFFGIFNKIEEDFFVSLTRRHLDHHEAFDPSFITIIPRVFSENYSIKETNHPINAFRVEGSVYRILTDRNKGI